MNYLVTEIILRLAKAAVAAFLGLALFAALTWIGGIQGSAELGLLCWISGAAFILLVQESPL